MDGAGRVSDGERGEGERERGGKRGGERQKRGAIKTKHTHTHAPPPPPRFPQGTGLSPALIAACDYLVYIPHTGRGTASLNVACAAAVVLHAYAAWAGAPEAEREGGKYVVAPRPQRTAPRGVRKRGGGKGGVPFFNLFRTH